MNVAIFHKDVGPEFGRRLEAFEQDFEYPLSAETTFRISHSPDYLRFFRAMGEAVCFVAHDDGKVRGVLTAVKRILHLPGSGVQEALYLCDLKISPGLTQAKVFLELAGKAKRYYSGRIQSAYGVVMAGTAAPPDRYTGCWGIPRFEEIGEIGILRIPVTAGQCRLVDPVEPAQALGMFESLTHSRSYACLGSPELRSKFSPVGLLTEDGQACGLLEDTLASKRLISGSEELSSGHLSNFAFRNLHAAQRIVESALSHCSDRGLPALFLALPKAELQSWLASNPYPNCTVTSAKLFGVGISPGQSWIINTAEV